MAQKWPFWKLCLGNRGQENVFYDIWEQKNAFLCYKNNKFKKSKNWHLSKGVNPWFWCKNGQFSNFFFLGNRAQENVFYDILERRNAFLRYKNKKFKKSKPWHFSKGVNPWFWSKNGNFSNFFFLRQYRPGKMFFTIFENEKNAFLGYKKNKIKRPNIDIFPKGLTHGFGAKMAIIPTFFFRQYRPGKCLLRYSRTKKRFSRL